MKFLVISSLTQISQALTSIDTGESTLFAKIEAYSCKKAGNDKKLYADMERNFQEIDPSSPKMEKLSVSPFGPLTEKTSRHIFMDLISTLNHAFPDYDFSDVNAEQFTKEPSYSNAINNINTSLSTELPSFREEISPRMWSSIDEEITIQDCDIYSFIPDPDSDPFEEENNAWSFNYFFYNKKRKRILLFACRAKRKLYDDSYEWIESEEAYDQWVYNEMDIEAS